MVADGSCRLRHPSVEPPVRRWVSAGVASPGWCTSRTLWHPEGASGSRRADVAPHRSRCLHARLPVAPSYKRRASATR